MRLLVLTSRYTATRDIIGEDFGRQTRLFSALKKIGYDIDFFVADYRRLENKNTKLHGINVMIRPFSTSYFFSFLRKLNAVLKSKKYDFLIASSDPLWGVAGYFFAKKHKIKFVYDLHDNYETYASYRMPFLGQLDRHAVNHSDILTTVTFALKDKISSLRKSNVFVIQNGVDLNLFKPVDRVSCRKRLGLPLNAKIIGYTGTLQKSLGVDILTEIFEKMREEMPGLKLLLVGRFGTDKSDDPRIKKEKIKDIISFDAVNQRDVALAINAADVVVVPSPTNEFTKYCFPYKCAEYMACNTPIVATKLSDVKIMLKDYPESLCEPDDKDALYDAIKRQLGKGKINYRKKIKNNSWDKIALKLDGILKKYVSV